MAKKDLGVRASSVGGRRSLSSKDQISSFGGGPARSGGLGWARRWAWVPLPVLLVSMVALWVAKPAFSYESGWLVLLLNVPFTLITGALVAYLVGRSFVGSGVVGLLLLGCGMCFWAAAAVVATAVGGFGEVNHQITIHNTCVWLSAVCHLSGVLLSRGPGRRCGQTGLWLGVGYGPTAGVVG